MTSINAKTEFPAAELPKVLEGLAAFFPQAKQEQLLEFFHALLQETEFTEQVLQKKMADFYLKSVMQLSAIYQFLAPYLFPLFGVSY